MASGKKLGLFWGANAFSVIESNQDTPVANFRVPFQAAGVADQATPAAKTQADDVRLVSALKEHLKARKINLSDVHLSLPSKDIVIRSFIIPFLKPHEIKGVVEFEIKKYIPFNLKELSYSFHATPLIEDKVKRMRVHFVAIRREILEHYSSILKQAGLNVIFSEPAPMCLTRALIFKKHIKPEQRVAIVQTDFYDSRIIVYDSGVVQFVRDFQLHNPALNAPAPEPEILKKKLFNEIKISLDFYMRQFKNEKISEVLTISFDPQQDFVEQLQTELEIPVRKIDPLTIVNSSDAQDIGIINAYGAVLNPPAKTAFFNLSGATVVTKPMGGLPAGIPIPEEYLPAVKVGAVCAALLLVVFILTNVATAQTKKKYDLLVDNLGPFLDMSVENIQEKIDENTSKLDTVKNIFRRTEMASYLVRLPKVLPESVWLTDLTMQYTDVQDTSKSTTTNADQQTKASAALPGMLLDVAGYVYTKDTNQQFRVVYSIVSALKSDDLFKKYLKSVNLSSIQSEQREKDTVTSFKINGK
jgi:Tfp pilus assembly PilM family ATPase